MTQRLKKLLDNTPEKQYNIFKRDGEGFDLSPICPTSRLGDTLYSYYTTVKEKYEEDPSLFTSPPVFAGGFFRDILWARDWPADLDLFINSHGLDKYEAEDNLCLFLHSLGLEYAEHDPSNYAGLGEEGSFRVFNVFGRGPGLRCHLQVILKDLGPPENDPLYVTKDFHYNHAKAVLPIVGPPAVTYHSHAVAGYEHKIHVQYRDRGLEKCEGLGLMGRFSCLDLSENGSGLFTKKEGESHLAAYKRLLQAQNKAHMNRIMELEQFNGLQNNRRPVP